MGGSSWSDDDYDRKVSHKVNTRGTAFTYTKDISDGVTAPKVHTKLDPKNVKMRESRDSAAHPESNAVMVGLDVTGSMGSVVKAIHAKLPTLMGLLLRKNYLSDPQVMFSAIGDATCDKSPLQIGQFESGDEMEDDLGNFHIEGGGGGQQTESYELFAYVGARKTSIDCFEKRGKKGYCFIIGDEMPYPNVKKREVDALINAELEADLTTAQIFKELKEKYITFFILPRDASNGSDGRIESRWVEILDKEHVLHLEDANAVAELIATQIGLCEGITDIDSAAKDLEEHGVSTALVKAVTGSVSKGYTGGAITKVPAGSVPTSGGPSSVKRI